MHLLGAEKQKRGGLGARLGVCRAFGKTGGKTRQFGGFGGFHKKKNSENHHFPKVPPPPGVDFQTHDFFFQFFLDYQKELRKQTPKKNFWSPLRKSLAIISAPPPKKVFIKKIPPKQTKNLLPNFFGPKNITRIPISQYLSSKKFFFLNDSLRGGGVVRKTSPGRKTMRLFELVCFFGGGLM